MTTKRNGTIEVWKSKRDGKFYFHLRASNGKITLPAGQGYTRRIDLIKTLKAVRDIFREGRFVIVDSSLKGRASV